MQEVTTAIYLFHLQRFIHVLLTKKNIQINFEICTHEEGAWLWNTVCLVDTYVFVGNVIPLFRINMLFFILCDKVRSKRNAFRYILFLCGALRDLVPSVQFRKREKHPWRRVTFSIVEACNVTKNFSMSVFHVF